MDRLLESIRAGKSLNETTMDQDKDTIIDNVKKYLTDLYKNYGEEKIWVNGDEITVQLGRSKKKLLKISFEVINTPEKEEPKVDGSEVANK